MLGVHCLMLVIMLQLHRLMIVVSGVTGNHDGREGSALIHWFGIKGGWKKQRRTDIRVNVDLASLPGPYRF